MAVVKKYFLLFFGDISFPLSLHDQTSFDLIKKQDFIRICFISHYLVSVKKKDM